MTATEATTGVMMRSGTEHGSRRSTAILITGAGGEVGHGLISALYRSGRRDIVTIDLRQLDPSLRDLCLESYAARPIAGDV